MTKVTCEGFLDKQRRFKKSWRMHWFVLEGDQLLYFKDRERTSPRGLIDLGQTKYSIGPDAIYGTRPFRIILQTEHRSHILSADSEKYREYWLNNIEKAMRASLRRTFSINRSPSCNTLSDEEISNISAASSTDDILSDLISENSSENKSRCKEKLSDVYQSKTISQLSTNVNVFNDVQEISCNLNSNSNSINIADQSHISLIPMDSFDLIKTSSSSLLSASDSLGGSLSDDVLLATFNIDLNNLTIDSDNIDDVFNKNCSIFPPIPSLPHPRLELLSKSWFDEVRIFIAQHRDPDEIFETVKSSGNGDSNIEKLKAFLNRDENITALNS